ncbi:MAG: hypothetical protein DDT19_02714 [Syntrophomonadaceae bacterium]|nr:hypothetical protein [Bacillota bacterium]
MKGNNNRYDDEFKTSSVKMVAEKGRTISAVAKDLGVSEPAQCEYGNIPENMHRFGMRYLRCLRVCTKYR